ncbi:MAG: beta-lactamase family protein [Acidobacteria bacterium]|nr:beta-lactamase family protein [Acidobacteriota bacterium]
MRLKNAPGVAVAVVKDGKVIKSAGYGLSNIETNTRATADTVFEIGSVTKQFTAAAIMLLAQDGKLAVSDTIGKYFPDAPESWNKITIRHLLTHTSGIQNHVEVPGYLDRFKTDLSFRTTPAGEEKLRMFFELPLEFEASKTWAYDNTGYILLGHIIEKVSGDSYYEYLDERIFNPLGMANTRSTSPLQVVKGRASGYGWANGKFENRPTLLPGIAFSAGAMLSTVIDMAKWDAALHTDRILTAESKKVMWDAARANDGSTLPFDHGFGWFLDNYRGHRLVQHSGATPGFSSVFYRFPDAGLSVIILTNFAGTSIDHWAIDVAAKYLPSLDRSKAIRDTDPSLTAQHRSMLTALADQKFDGHNVTPQMDMLFKTATGASLFSWYLDGSPIKSFELSSIEKRPGGQMRRYRAMAGKNLFEVSFLANDENRVAQILWW